MSYRMMPPGSYHFWRIGMLSPFVRWAITGSAMLALVMMWYVLTQKFLFTSAADQLWCAQCTAQLAELAHIDEVALMQSDSAQLTQHPSLALLNLCEQHGLTVQSCTNQKSSMKNNLSRQRVNIICSGSLVQFQAFFVALSAQTIPISNLEAQLTEQSSKLYRGTLAFDYMLLD
jgi:hypothetical protein